MSRRKPDVSRRIRPSQALKAAGERGLPPRMAADPETGVPVPDFLRDPEPEVFQAPEPPGPSGPEVSEPETPEPEVDDRTLGEVLGVLPDLPAGPPPGVMSDLPRRFPMPSPPPTLSPLRLPPCPRPPWSSADSLILSAILLAFLVLLVGLWLREGP
jgi:hypothetical protein